MTNSRYGPRSKIAVYALRNYEEWKVATPTGIRAELDRYDLEAKQSALFDDDDTEFG
jgi:hypothetical protein